MCPESTLAVADTEVDAEMLARRSRFVWGLVWTGLLVGLFLHVFRSMDTSLVYYGDMVGMPSGSFLLFPVFERGGVFFNSLVSQPGGLTEWVGAYLSQWFILPLWGAGILTAVAVALFFVINAIVSHVAGVRTWVTGLVGVVLLVFIWNRYEFNLADCLAVVVSLGAVVLVVKQRRALVRDVSVVVGTLGLYYVVGAPAMLFAMLCGLHELCIARRYIATVAWWVVGACTPYLIGVVLMSLPVRESYIRLSGLGRYGLILPGNAISTVFWGWVSLYALPVVAVLAVTCYQWLSARRPERPFVLSSDKVRRIALASVIVLGVVGVHTTLDRDARWVLRLHACAVQDAWGELLVVADAREGRLLSPQLTRHINRALFERGTLGSRMFAYPQCVGGLLAQPSATGASAEAPETLLQLGLVNQAEHGACRLLERWGPRPTTLKLMAMIFIAKDEPDTARTFLRRLKRDVIWDDWARDMLDRLDDDPTLAGDEQIERIRRIRPVRPDFAPQDVRAILVLRLTEGPNDRMVFEYCMATQLAAKQLAPAVSLLLTFGESQGYLAPPEHYAEAAAMYMLQTNQRPPLGDLMPRTHTIRRAVRSVEISKHRAAPLMFADEMPNSYCRYLWTGSSGDSTHD
jgi:hypothetical protein